MPEFNDAIALSFVQGQAYRINTRVYETRYPDYDFSRLIFVDSTGPEWSPGVITYSSNISGRAEIITAASKDMPFADVSQDRTLVENKMLGIGYTYNIEEINAAIQVGGSLDSRRANAARKVYMKSMYDIALTGLPGATGLLNSTAVTDTTAPADGTGSVTFWVNSAGVGTKTPAQIVRDINLALQGIYLDTFQIEMADTIRLPVEAYIYIAGTPYSATTTETILSFIQRTNIYTMTTGQPLTITAHRELSTAGAGSTGRMVAYKNDEETARLHLPMAHRFLPVYQDGWGSYVVPGIFRTGGVEIGNLGAIRYVDGISQPPA
jgi:hypothetical protein